MDLRRAPHLSLGVGAGEREPDSPMVRELMNEAAHRCRPHVGMAASGCYNWVPVATPTSASPQSGHRHGKSTILLGRLLHTTMVLGGSDVAEPLLDHVWHATPHRRGVDLKQALTPLQALVV
jgi:hypothetical protein